MTDAQSTQITKLEKLHAAWLPMVEFLFGSAAPDVKFDGFEVNNNIAKPVMLFESSNEPYRYKIQMPARSFTNDVMLLADVVQEMVRGLYPVGFKGNEDGNETTNLCEGSAIYGAITAIKQVFGDETVDSYLDTLRDQAFAYYDAFSYVATLLADDPQAIKKLRDLKPFLFEVQKSDFTIVKVEAEKKIQDVLLFTFRT